MFDTGHNFLTRHFAQRFNLLANCAAQSRHRQIAPRPNLRAINRGGMNQEANS